MRKMVYILIFIGMTFITVGLYLSVRDVDNTIRETKEKVEEIAVTDSMNWVDINRRTNERWNKIDSVHNEILILLKK